jgi:hypothetical protein
VLVSCQNGEAQGLAALGPAWSVRPTAELLESLERLLGSEALQLLYETSTSPGLRTGSPAP